MDYIGTTLVHCGYIARAFLMVIKFHAAILIMAKAA
jgi:hypothetical protein